MTSLALKDGGTARGWLVARPLYEASRMSSYEPHLSSSFGGPACWLAGGGFVQSCSRRTVLSAQRLQLVKRCDGVITMFTGLVKTIGFPSWTWYTAPDIMQWALGSSTYAPVAPSAD